MLFCTYTQQTKAKERVGPGDFRGSFYIDCRSCVDTC